MDQNRSPLSALILGVCLIVCSMFIANGYKASKPTDQYSQAAFSGHADQTVTSDKVKWSITLTRVASSSEEALSLIEKDHDTLKKLFADHGITDADYSFHPATSQNYNYDYGYDYEGYPTTTPKTPKYYADQIVVIESSKVDEMGALSEQAYQYQFNASKKEFAFTSRGIEFIYSKLDDSKKELTKKAIADAHDSASQLLGDQLGSLRSMALPTFSVQPENSPDYYYQNQADTSSIKKKVSVSVTVNYNLQ